MKKLKQSIKNYKPMAMMILEITLCIALWVGLFKLIMVMI